MKSLPELLKELSQVTGDSYLWEAVDDAFVVWQVIPHSKWIVSKGTYEQVQSALDQRIKFYGRNLRQTTIR